MTRASHGADLVLLDSSPFFRFCEGGQVINLRAYLDKRARITMEVADELKRKSTSYRDLKTLEYMRWPRDEHKLELPAALKQELFDILRAIQAPGEHPLAHAGEISTVLMGEHLGGKLIVLEDHDGKALATTRAVPRMSTAMLAAEMVVVSAISEPEGYRVYEKATPAHVGKPEWTRALKRAHEALPATSPPPSPRPARTHKP